MTRTLHRWDSADKARLRDMYSRMTATEVARALSLAPRTVQEYARKFGCRRKCKAAPGAGGKLTPGVEKALYRMWPYYTSQFIARYLGVSRTSVCRWATKLGLRKSAEFYRTRALMGAETKRKNRNKPTEQI